ncbi:MAG: type II toxin-antitoxin system HicA family toxin [Candidatus Sungbacteria bacterium]|nr:type II toxin-antitoxin system HicA family toxin [Candidatus Sungbacteria bacterium]
MSRLPILRAREVIRALERAGFVSIRQKGSHIFLRNPVTKRTTVVPIHEREDIDRDFLAEILTDAGIGQEEFRKLI